MTLSAVSAEKMTQHASTAPRPLLHHARSLCAGDASSRVHAPVKMTRSSSSPELPDTRSSCVLQHEPRSTTSPDSVVASQSLGLSCKNASQSSEPAAVPAHMMDFDVFLAGSCNPTTWRQEVAIPLLDHARVKYYNPQVDDWYEELIAIETHVMETAKVLLIVIDSITRTLVSINEAIEYICRGRRVVLVVDDIAPGTLIEGVSVTPEELVDLNGARACLRSLAVKKQTRLYGDVQDAVLGTIQWLQEDSVTSFVREAPRLWRRVSMVLSRWLTSKITKSRRNTTPRSASEKSPPTGSTEQHGSHTSGSIYLRGNGAKSTPIAVSMLQEAGIPFSTPSLDRSALEHSRQHGRPKVSSSHDRRDRWRDTHAEKDRTELILFVIPSHTPSIAAMTDAVELIASGHAVLLVIEPFEDGCVVSKDGRVISGREFKDLARARAYLQATAQRNDAHAFTSVADAVKSIGERL